MPCYGGALRLSGLPATGITLQVATAKQKGEFPHTGTRLFYHKIVLQFVDYNLGPAATNALPASLPVNFAKFLMKRPARSCAFASHSEAFA